MDIINKFENVFLDGYTYIYDIKYWAAALLKSNNVECFEYCNLQILKYLVENGFNDENIELFKKDNEIVVNYLWLNNVKFYSINEYSSQWAAMTGDIDHNNVNMRSLLYSSFFGHIEIVIFLLKNKAFTQDDYDRALLLSVKNSLKIASENGNL